MIIKSIDYYFRVYHPDTMIYVDISREPISWLESWHSWKQYGSHVKPRDPYRDTVAMVTVIVNAIAQCYTSYSAMLLTVLCF